MIQVKDTKPVTKGQGGGGEGGQGVYFKSIGLIFAIVILLSKMFLENRRPPPLWEKLVTGCIHACTPV